MDRVKDGFKFGVDLWLFGINFPHGPFHKHLTNSQLSSFS